MSFDDDVDTSEMPINIEMKGWEDILRNQCIEKVTASPDEIEVSSDDSDPEDVVGSQVSEEEKPKISLPAALQMLDQLQDFASSFDDAETQCQLADITGELEEVRLRNRKQAKITNFFPAK